MHSVQLESPLGGGERRLLLLAFLGLLLVLFLLNRLALGVKWLLWWVLTLWVVQEELERFASHDIIVHLLAKARCLLHVHLLDIISLGFIDETLQLVDSFLR